MLEISDFIVAVCENSAAKRMLRFVNRMFSLKEDIGVRLYGQTIYASTLDRIVVLYLKKLSLVETFETELLRSILKEGMTFIDIGANLGWYTLIASKIVGKDGRVFAFEPEPENFRLLAKNIAANGCQNVKIAKTAVSDKTGQVQLFLCEENRGDHRIYHSGNARRNIPAAAASLDDFFEGSFKIDAIKIDVQGAEGLVFKGMDKIIKANNPLFIMMEFCPKFLRMCGSDPNDFLSTVENYGFRTHFINESKKKLEGISVRELMSVFSNKKINTINLFLSK